MFGVSLYTETVDMRRWQRGTPCTDLGGPYSRLWNLVLRGWRKSRVQLEGGTRTLIAGTGSGPDGSSLTVNYQRSRGSGVENW